MWFETYPPYTVLHRTDTRLECETANGRSAIWIFILGIVLVLCLAVEPYAGLAVIIAGLCIVGHSMRWVFDRTEGLSQRNLSIFSYAISTRKYQMNEFRGIRIRKEWRGGEAAGSYYVLELMRRRSTVFIASRPTLPLIQDIADDLRKYLPEGWPLEVESSSSPFNGLKRFRWHRKGRSHQGS